MSPEELQGFFVYTLVKMGLADVHTMNFAWDIAMKKETMDLAWKKGL